MLYKFQFLTGYILWLAFISICYCKTIPSHLIFDDNLIENYDSFKVKLNRLQEKANQVALKALDYVNEYTTERHHGEIFEEFLSLFQRNYTEIYEEYKSRFIIFKASLKRHAWLNQQEGIRNGTARYGINKFSDWTPEEFQRLLKTRKLPQDVEGQNITFSAHNDADHPCFLYWKPYPKKIDWSKKITPIKDQGTCGSCWAFVASEQVESYWAIKGNPLIERSPQELISCSPSLGCNGGNTCAALIWMVRTQTALVLEKQYPYEERDDLCKYNDMPHDGPTLKAVCGCQKFVGKEIFMVYMMAQKGPLAVNVDSVLWHDYIGGIIQHHCTNRDMNHAVQLIGYNLEDDPVPYWIARNQWGASFGEDGLIRMKFGENICGLAEEPSFVAVY